MNKQKKDILIVFPDAHLSYSPSTLNLYDSLDEYFNVTIATFSPLESYSSQRVLNRNVEYLNFTNQTGIPLLRRLATELKKTLFPKSKSLYPLLTARAKVLIDRIKEFTGTIIAVDFFALWCVQQAGKSAHLFSLEIPENDPYKNRCDLNSILSVVIQTKDRYEYIFGEKEIRTFIVQNAPMYIARQINYEGRLNTNLVFCGSAMPAFGIFSCIEFILDYPEYSLTIKGAVPPSVRAGIRENFQVLIAEKRLILDEEYLDAEELNIFLADYYIGFVFYDAYRFDYMNCFNYKTAPSGKLFQYFNAGLPVVVSNIEGLKAVEQFGAGVMINALNAASIKKAIELIDADYLQIAKAAKKAALHNDFSKAIEPYIIYLNSVSGPQI